MQENNSMKTNPIFFTLADAEAMSAQRYLNVLDNIEKIKPAKARFVPPTIGGSGFGHFLVKWRYPKYGNMQTA